MPDPFGAALWAPILIGAAGELFGAKKASDASAAAAAIQAEAGKYAADVLYKSSADSLDFLKQQWAQAQENQAPWLTVGRGAITQLGELMGIPGQPVTKQPLTPTAPTLPTMRDPTKLIPPVPTGGPSTSPLDGSFGGFRSGDLYPGGFLYDSSWWDRPGGPKGPGLAKFLGQAYLDAERDAGALQGWQKWVAGYPSTACTGSGRVDIPNIGNQEGTRNDRPDPERMFTPGQPETDTVTMRAPDGTFKQVSRSEVPFYSSRGAVVVGSQSGNRPMPITR